MCNCSAAVSPRRSVQFAFRCVSAVFVFNLTGGSSGEVELEEDRLGRGDVSHGEFLSVRQSQLF